MEYLSNVRIFTTKKDLKEIKEKLSKVKSNILNICDVKKEFVGLDNLLYVILGWNNIEWYLNYKDIFIIEQTLKKFKATGKTFKFERIGQDNGDIEQDGSYNTEDIKLVENQFVTV